MMIFVDGETGWPVAAVGGRTVVPTTAAHGYFYFWGHLAIIEY